MTTNLPTRSTPVPNGTARGSNSTGRRGSGGSGDSRTPSEHSAKHESGDAARPRGRRGNSNGSAQTPNSTHSSAHAPQLVTQQRFKKLRSQYPRTSQERHVEYILVASFDIDKGPVMEHQFPGAISGDENMLAELMLPDQAHVRSEDWTIFFLHKDTTEEEEAREAAREERRMAREERREARRRAAEEGHSKVEEDSDSGQDEEDDGGGGGEGPPLIYVLNLVNTKQDNTVRRGAVVKAMAICTRHPFLHIYKPLLLLALEEYFKNPYLDTLEHLYNSVNTMDLSLMPRLTLLEKNILQGSDVKDLFVEKFDQMIQQRIAEDAENTLPDSPTRQTHDLTRRGYQLPRDTHQYETHVVYNSIPIPVKVPTAVSPETVGDFSLLKLIQIFSAPHISSPVPFALHPHLTTAGAYTHPIVVLVNAVLTQKRVVFLGHNRPSGEVAHAVLAACALASGGVLRGFTRHAFPYTDLSKIDDLLNVPGFIAGVTNPTFANHPEWWDLLCDLPTGRMKISSKIDPVNVTDGITFFQQQHPTYAPSNTGALPPATTQPPPNSTGPADPTGDIAFMDDIQRSISARHGESVIRSKFRDYVIKFTRIAAAFEEAVFGASALHAGAVEADAGAFGVSGHGYVWSDEVSRARELAANAWRIEGWRTTRAYYALIQDLALLWGRRPVRAIDVAHQLDRLRTLKLTKEQSARILIALRQAITGYAGVCQLLAAAPEHHAGLFYLGLGLWHPDRGAREATADLLERVKRHAAGRHAWRALGRFQHAACAKVVKEALARKRGKNSSDPDPAPDGYAAYAISTSPLPTGVGPMGVPGLGIGLGGGSSERAGSGGGGPATAPLGGGPGGIDSVMAENHRGGSGGGGGGGGGGGRARPRS